MSSISIIIRTDKESKNGNVPIYYRITDNRRSKFIAAGRLNAKIDKVGDIIETSRPDKKNSKYQEVIKKGDSLLNHIQKLVRVIDMK